MMCMVFIIVGYTCVSACISIFEGGGGGEGHMQL